MKPDITFIIPVLNESETINSLFESLVESYNKPLNFEVVIVDDGSQDETLSKTKNFKSLPFNCKIIKLSRNFGSHAAVRCGFLHASGKYALYLPSDLQISLNEVNKLYQYTASGKEVIFGTREVVKIGLLEKLFSRFYSFLMKRYVSSNFPKEGIETVLISQKVIQELNKNIESNSSFVLQIISLGFNTQFVKIEKTERKQGKSKWTASKKIKLFIDSFIAFSYAPIRFVTGVGIFLFIIGIIFSAYLITRKLLYNDLQSGWPMLISILTLGFGITNISLGIIAEYLWRTLDSSRKRPVFIIDKIIELNKHE